MANYGKSDEEWYSYLLDKGELQANGCLNCHAPTNYKGYSYIQPGGRKGKKIGAHRFIYEMTQGAIPPGYVVMHDCDNPRCIQPSHLRCGTYKDNTSDMMSKGRHKYEIKNRVVTPEMSADFIRMRAAGYTFDDIALHHKVSNHTVWKHCNGHYKCQ